MPRDGILKKIFVILFLIAVLFPVINIYFIYPSFTKLLVENTEEEAVRTANHLEYLLLSRHDTDLSKATLSDHFYREIDVVKRNFKFTKLKIFSNNGEIIYSTVPEEIGEINKHGYFHEIVAKGMNYTKVVKKDTESLEGKIVKADVVETYVPIMKDTTFLGAFEIYYDITERNKNLNNVVIISSIIPLGMTIMFLIVTTLTIFRLDRSIIARNLAQTELREFADKLEKSNMELQSFAHIASHDLQEPLRKVMSFGDRLAAKYTDALGDQGCDYLNRMQTAAKRMQHLINGLLMFSRVTTKAQPFQPVDLSTVANEVLSDLEIRIQETQGKVEIEHLPTLNADPLQMRQLFQNLIGNALKFNKKNEPPLVKVSVNRNDTSEKAYCQLKFEDNGIGFDEQYADRIFGVFQRLHGRNEYEGSGIGLSVCRKIVERHGGMITAKSSPGEGAKFIVTLPVNQANEECNGKTESDENMSE